MRLGVTVNAASPCSGRPRPQACITAAHTSRANGSSVEENTSGLYSNPHCVPGRASSCSRTNRVLRTARSSTSCCDSPNTTRRNTGAVALYRCTTAWRAPASESIDRAIRSSRACVSTLMVTSSGTRPASMMWRTKSKSVCEAAGNPTSISFTPICSSVSNIRSLRAVSIGSNSAWLPSRRSVDSQRGAWSRTRDGQRRSGRSMGGNGRYLPTGGFIIAGTPGRNGRGGTGARGEGRDGVRP